MTTDGSIETSVICDRVREFPINPIKGVIEGFRSALTGRGQAPSSLLVASVSMVIVAAVDGLLFLNPMEGANANRV